MAELTRANRQLFERSPDERCEDVQQMWQRCQTKRNAGRDLWEPPADIRTAADEIRPGEKCLRLVAGTDGYSLNAWSFSQLCKMAGVAKDTVNRLSAETADRVFRETLPREGGRPLQLFVEDGVVRSVHGTAYTRLWDVEVVNVLREFAVDFTPPQKGFNGATGLYVGEQDMFAFLIDPAGWCEIGEEAYAPGFFVWNSEVGRRSVGISTFWFQKVCSNHLVWQTRDVEEFTRKHTASVRDGLTEIRRIIEGLVEKRDARKDGFVRVMRKAQTEKLGDDAEEALKALTRHGLGRAVAKRALEIAATQGGFTVYSVVDALTRMAREYENAGDRLDADQRAATLLSLVEA